jgi:hypothetical protein
MTERTLASQVTRHPGTAVADLQTLLDNDNRRLETLFEELVAALRGGDENEAGALWDAFASGLESHMTLEEERMLPAFAEVDGAEAAELVREHEAIRCALGELGLGMDLHYTTPAALERFARTLRTHARREDALMYRWARANLPEDVQTSIRAQLLAARLAQVSAGRHQTIPPGPIGGPLSGRVRRLDPEHERPPLEQGEMT